MPNYAQDIPAPDPASINSYCHPARVSTMTQLLGKPALSTNPAHCHPSAQVRQLLVTKDVGPFTVTGLQPFVHLLTRVFARVHAGDPALYAAVASAGVLCARFVRGSTVTPSNHSWGTAIDIAIRDPRTGTPRLDLPLDNGRVQAGCLKLYTFFKQEAQASGEWCFWGAGFHREDGMHFEASDELIRMWHARRDY